MKSKTVALLSGGVAGAAALLACYFVFAPTKNEAVTAPPGTNTGNTHPSPVMPAPHAVAMSVPKGGRAEAALPLAPETSASENAMGIRATHLSEARKLADDMETNLEQYLSGMAEPAYFTQSLRGENPSRKLALRLGMDSSTARKAEAVFTAYLAEQIKRRQDAERKRMEREGRLLADDRENYVNYLALQSMAARGVSLSKEQQAFFTRFREMLEPEGGSVAQADAPNWYENPELLQEITQELPPAQRSGLAAYVEEQKRRAQEVQTMHAYMRSNMIAEKLGLDDEDRNALYQYLSEHPGAARSDVAKILAPELKELLPEGM